MATIDLQSSLNTEWKPTHYTRCVCGERVELYEVYNGVQLSFQRVKKVCKCGKNYSLDNLFSLYGCKGY